MSFPWYDTIVGGIKGSLMGAVAAAQLSGGNPYAIIAGAVIGGVAGNIEGYNEGEEKNELEDKSQKSATAAKQNQELNARRQADAMYKAAAADPKASSATMFRKAGLTREASNNYAAIRDQGNAFRPADDKATKQHQFYGKTAAVSKAA